MKKTIMILIPILIVLQLIGCYKIIHRDTSPDDPGNPQVTPGSVPGISEDTDGDSDGDADEDSDSEIQNDDPDLNPDLDPDFNNEPKTMREMTAADLVADIRIGWSLGNTLDAHDGPGGFSWLGGGVYANTSVTELETGWSRPLTKPEHFAVIKEAGFNAVRIPVTWFKVIDDNYNIREDWMTRVKEVVDYAVDLDLFVIINTHHDDSLFKLNSAETENSINALTRIWVQIATTFKDYNEKLFFEGLNEPRTIGSPNEWRGGTEEEHDILNILNQTFVDTVRATGGNNEERVLLIPTYAASANETAQRALVIPNDTANNKIVVSLHYYEPWNFALRTGEGSVATWNADNPEDTETIIKAIDLAYELFVSKGIPVIIGEMGAINRDNTEARAEWAEFYTAYAKTKNIPCFWWDNGSYWLLRQRDWGWEQTFGLLNRETIIIAHPEIIEALIRGIS